MQLIGSIETVQALLIEEKNGSSFIKILATGSVPDSSWSSLGLVFKQVKGGILEYEFGVHKKAGIAMCMVMDITAEATYEQQAPVRQVKIIAKNGAKETSVMGLVDTVDEIDIGLLFDDKATPYWQATVKASATVGNYRKSVLLANSDYNAKIITYKLYVERLYRAPNHQAKPDNVMTSITIPYRQAKTITVTAKQNTLSKPLPQGICQMQRKVSQSQLKPYTFPLKGWFEQDECNKENQYKYYLLCEFTTDDPKSTISKIAIVHHHRYNNILAKKGWNPSYDLTHDEFRIYPKPKFAGLPHGNKQSLKGACNALLDYTAIRYLGEQSKDGSRHIWVAGGHGYGHLNPVYIHSIFAILKKHQVLVGKDTDGQLEASILAAMNTPNLRCEIELRYEASLVYPGLANDEPVKPTLRKLSQQGFEGLTFSELKQLTNFNFSDPIAQRRLGNWVKDIKRIAQFKLYRGHKKDFAEIDLKARKLLSVAGLFSLRGCDDVGEYIASHLTIDDVPEKRWIIKSLT